MPEDLQMLLFDIEGRAEMLPPIGNSNKTTPDPKFIRDTVTSLNQETESITEKIEREVKKILPPFVTVQANIQFNEGSLVMTGTVALLTWAGTVVFDAARDEVQQQLGMLVKLAIQRAMSRVFALRNLHNNVGAMEMSVTPQVITTGNRGTHKLAGSTTHPPQPTAVVSSSRAVLAPTAATALFVITGIIFVLQLMLLFDRFFVIHFKP